MVTVVNAWNKRRVDLSMLRVSVQRCSDTQGLEKQTFVCRASGADMVITMASAPAARTKGRARLRVRTAYRVILPLGMRKVFSFVWHTAWQRPSARTGGATLI